MQPFRLCEGIWELERKKLVNNMCRDNVIPFKTCLAGP